MIRAWDVEGRLIIGITRSVLEKLVEGMIVTSPTIEGRGPDVVIVFGESEAAILAHFRKDGTMGAATEYKDVRRS